MPATVALAASNAASAALSAAVAVPATSTAIAVASAAYWTAYVGTTLAISYAANAAFAPKPPPMGSVGNPIKQSMPPRQSGYGRTRISGPYMLFEAANGVSSDVIALHDNGEGGPPIDGFERYFLHDDEVVISGPGGGIVCPKEPQKYAYGDIGDRVFINTRLGLATETAFDRPINDVPLFWDASCRGDGIASLNLTCKQSKQKYQQEDFPNGLPLPSAVARLQKVFDPRQGQDQTNNGTWEWSANPVLALLSYLTTAPGGLGLNYARRIAPAIATWQAAANDCDRATALVSGDSEARYACGGIYQHTTAPSEVINQILQSFDGWLSQRGDGALVVLPGRYIPPTVTFRDEHVVAYQLSHYTPDEEAINELIPSFSDPESLYNQVDAGAWQDQDDIAARGVVRSEPLPLPWVQSPSQARRLAKRKMSRLTAPLRGWVTLNLYGFVALGERYFRLRVEENAAISDIICEVARVRMDLNAMQVTFEWVQADPDIDAWNRFSEEQPLTEATQRPDVAPLEAPVITDAEPFYETTSAGVLGARLRLEVASPIAADVEWIVRWRRAGTTNWSEGSYSDIADGVAVQLETGFVSADATIELETAYVTAATTSPWSPTFTVAVPVSTTAPFLDEGGFPFLDEAGLTFYQEG